MKRTTIFMNESVEADLHGLARRQQRPVAALVREAVEQYVAGQRRAGSARPGFVAIGRSGAADTAERHEAMLFADVRPHGAAAVGPAKRAAAGVAASGRVPRRRR
jgi:predicted transcriptional regulator